MGGHPCLDGVPVAEVVAAVERLTRLRQVEGVAVVIARRAIEKAKIYLARFLQGFPLDKLHVATFITTGTPIAIKHPSAAGVDHAFKGQGAGGGTVHGSGIRALQHIKPQLGESDGRRAG